MKKVVRFLKDCLGWGVEKVALLFGNVAFYLEEAAYKLSK